jgi:Asp-tRNA(Asn)/Glu-tRNA(Gln) amidotransferase A subunit family amidase
MPCGLAADGMPAAVQLVGRHHREAALLAVARWCERRLEFQHLPPWLNL